MSTIKDKQTDYGNQYITRPAIKSDANAVALLAQSLAIHEGVISLFHASNFEHDFADKHFCKIIVAENSETAEIVGFIMFYTGYDLTSASRGLHLGDIFVADQHRGYGVGRRLFRAAAEWGRDHADAEWMSWTALKANSSALKFYESLGAITRHDIAFQAVSIGSGLIK